MPTGPDDGSGCPAGATLPPDRRSIILEVVTRLLFHVLIVFSIYLLFAGHNAPGGGFAGGLVAGLALVVRYLAGGRYELDEAAPIDAGVLLGAGLSSQRPPALARCCSGGDVLQSAKLDVASRCSATCTSSRRSFFDIGVYLIVVGLVLDILRSLGAEIDRQILEDDDRAMPATGRQAR